MRPTGEFCLIEQQPVVFARVKETGEEVKVVKTREFYASENCLEYWYDLYPYKENGNIGYFENELEFDY